MSMLAGYKLDNVIYTIDRSLAEKCAAMHQRKVEFASFGELFKLAQNRPAIRVANQPVYRISWFAFEDLILAEAKEDIKKAGMNGIDAEHHHQYTYAKREEIRNKYVPQRSLQNVFRTMTKKPFSKKASNEWAQRIDKLHQE